MCEKKRTLGPFLCGCGQLRKLIECDVAYAFRGWVSLTLYYKINVADRFA